ncbi:MAG: spondin domain-containing protein [Bacteroidota bacterium]
MRVVAALFVLLALGCDATDPMAPDPLPPDPPPPAPTLEPATFRITFDASWSAQSHPDMFPGNPHFSRLTGAVHATDVSLWSVGEMASDGIRQMAETGGVSMLEEEVNALGEAMGVYVEGGPIRTSPGTASVTVTVTEARPVVSVVTMLAPSPDWFIGIDGLDLREGDGWADRMEIDAVVYDAGTDDGATYVAANAPRSARAPIADVAYAPLAGTSVGTLVVERVEDGG